MKREKISRGRYRRARKQDKEHRYLLDGRGYLNMSDLKYDEYCRLISYIWRGRVNTFGRCITVYRFYKNMKYRKRYIKLYKKMKGR